MKKVQKIITGVVTSVGVAAGNAMAAVNLENVVMDTTTVETLAATVLVGLGVIWGIRKLIKLSNRS